MSPQLSRLTPSAGRVQITIIGLMFALSVISYFDRTILSIAGPNIMKEFSLSETQLGVIVSSFTFSYAILMIPTGHLSDRFGPRLVLTSMALGSALFTMLTAAAGKPGFGALIGIIPSFVVMRMAMGVFTSPLYPACGRVNANWTSVTQRSRVQSFVNAGAGMGSALSPIIFVRLIAHFGWRMSFCIAGAFTGVLGLIWHWYARDYPREHPFLSASDRKHLSETVGVARRELTGPAPWRKLLTDRNLVLLTIGYFAVDYFEYIFYYWIYYYLGTIRRLGAEESAGYTSMLFLTWVVVTPIGGWISDRMVARFGRRQGLRIVGISGLVLSAALMFAGINAEATGVAVACMSLALGLASCSDVAYWAAAIEVGGKQVGAACGMMNSGGNIGGFLAPIMTPYIASFFGWTWGLYFGCIVVLIGVVVWFFIDAEKVIDADS